MNGRMGAVFSWLEVTLCEGVENTFLWERVTSALPHHPPTPHVSSLMSSWGISVNEEYVKI